MKMVNSKSSRKVLVTGAGGFIGSHLVELMVQQGFHVRAFVRYNSRNDIGQLSLLDQQMLNQVEIISGDLRDSDAVLQAVKGVDAIFHLGALIAIPYSYLHPKDVIETNVIGTTNVLLAARECGTERVIHTSTSEVYGSALRVPIDEDHPLQGQSPYSASKIGADKVAESFHRSFGLPIITVRPFNTFGPRQSDRAVIPTIISQALTQDHLTLGSLDTRRDFTYATDTANGFLCAYKAPESVFGQVYNLGTGKDVTIGEIVEAVRKIVGKDLPVETDSARIRPAKSEVLRLLSDNSKAKREIGWEPTVSLEEGLAKTTDWIREHLNLYRPDRYQR
jgi:dTDP-glucose 4,6-dehydratase